MKSTINDRIRAIAEHYGIKSYTEFGKRVGVSPQNAANYLKNNKSPDLGNLRKIQLTFREVDAEWLLTGKGDMLRVDPDEGSEGIPDYKEGEREIISQISPESIFRYVTKEGAHRFKGNKALEYYIEALVFEEMSRMNMKLHKEALNGTKRRKTAD